jgi:hypothetical protein
MRSLGPAEFRCARTSRSKSVRPTWPIPGIVGGLLSTIMLSTMLILAPLLLTGCGRKEPPRTKSWPAKGKLLVNGAPPERAEVTLHAKIPLKDKGGRELFPHASVAADGSFELQTYEDGDGAPPGEYVVPVIWPEIKKDGGEELLGPDRLHNNFSDPKFPVATVVIEPHENIIPPIELKPKSN